MLLTFQNNLAGTVAATVLPSGIASGEAVPEPRLTQLVQPPGIVSAEQFGTTELDRFVVPSGIASAEAVGSPGATPGAVAVVVGGIATAAAFGSVQVGAGGFPILAQEIGPAEAFGSPTVARGAAFVAPSGIATGEAVGAPTATRGAATVAPGAIGSAEAFGAPVAASGGVTIGPPGVPSAEAFGPLVTVTAPVLEGTLLPTAVPSAEAFGTPAALPGVATVAPAAVPSAEAFGSSRVGLAVAAGSVDSAEAFGVPHLEQGAAVVQTVGVLSSEAFGIPTLVSDQVVLLSGVASGELFGTPVFGRGAHALITELIDKYDNAEIICEQIAAILVVESEHQQALAQAAGRNPEAWRLRVYHERSNAWAEFIEDPDNGTADASPIVNVSYEGARFDMGKGNTVERQRATGTFHIDCYGYGVSADVPTGGHTPGDELAALEVKRALRLVRNILMSGVYTYLGLRGTVGRRWPDSINVFQPTIDGRQVQHVVGGRMSLVVEFNEFSPQVQGEIIELTSVQVQRADTGQVLLRAAFAS